MAAAKKGRARAEKAAKMRASKKVSSGAAMGFEAELQDTVVQTVLQQAEMLSEQWADVG